jgi:polyhydroxybutyrate depolymerase
LVGVVLLAVLAAGCSWFPGGVPTTGPREPVASGGCVARTPRAPGTETVATTSDGVARTYLRRIPQGYDPAEPIPVLFAIHGLGEGAEVHVMMSEWGPRADAARFIVIYPQGLGAPARWNTTLGSADLAFFGHLLDEVEADLCVDRRRVYAAGLSNGAFMSSSIGCQFADRVAAIGLVAGMRNPAGCAPSRPVPAVTFHGDLDTFVPFSPVAGIVAAWAERNTCVSQFADEPVAADVALSRYFCPTGTEVGFYRIAGGGHAWPGSAFSRQVESVVGFTTFSIHASDIMWDFFAHHPLPPPT